MMPRGAVIDVTPPRAQRGARVNALAAAASDGYRSAFGRPGLVLLLWLANLLAALPAAVLVTRALERSFGDSLVAERMREGFDMTWFGEFSDRAQGLAATFGPTLSSAGGFFQNLESWATGRLFAGIGPVLAVGAAYVLLWELLLGGVLARLADPAEPGGPTRLLRRGAEYFFRFVRLSLLSAPLYYGVYRLHRWMDGRLADLTRDVTVERTVLLWTLAMTAVTVLLLALVHLAFNYARIVTLLEGRRSMLFAALRGVRFTLARPLQTLGLYLAVALPAAGLLALYAATASPAGQTTAASVAAALGAGQLVLVLRVALRLALLGGQISLYRRAAQER